ncbi:MAG: phosphate/phosphite/phosphonate ABC transporter substrate-binding protein [Rhodospirillales bacterium]|nr:MAG: phosphate/phosphite/phosphonate ABC transporter substrate-binding protein [Rhodospirillales bacterium]
MRVRALFLAVAFFLPLTGSAQAAQKNAPPPAILEIGVLPYLNMESLLRTYGPLAVFLEKETGKTTRIVSARDYPHLLQLTASKAYSLLVTASHFARLAQQDSGYIPLLIPLTTYHELILVKSDSPLAGLADLKGKNIAIPDPLAQTSIMGRAQLRWHGLDPDKDVTLSVAGSHTNAMLGLQNGSYDAAVVSEGGYNHMDEAAKQNVRILPVAQGFGKARPEAIPVAYVASPELPVKEREKLTTLISRFANDTAEGKAWINGLGYKGLRPPKPEEMAAQDIYVTELRRIMAASIKR